MSNNEIHTTDLHIKHKLRINIDFTKVQMSSLNMMKSVLVEDTKL